MQLGLDRKLFFLLAALPLFLFASCSKKTIGWGVLLWYTEEPAIPSGTVLPIQIRSNIEQAWIATVPEEYSTEENQRMAIPLPHLEFFRTRGRAERYAANFTYAQTYAETIQDGLPVRDKPENNARRVYRLKEREIIKILEKTEGVAAISNSGSPLEGDWYKVLTKSGSIGYCFSYRLNMFEHTTGSLEGEEAIADTSNDRELELVLSRTWYPESYRTMINSRHIDLDALSKNYSFTAGLSNGKARIHLEQGDAVFPYRKVVKTGDQSWNFEGTSLNVIFRSEDALEIRWEDDKGNTQNAVFVTLPLSVENIVNQEKERRQNKFQALFVRGPSFTSATYGTLVLSGTGKFTWDEINTLPEGIITNSVLGSGTLDLDYELGGEMVERYTGALALQTNSVSGRGRVLVFAYTLDNQGLRMEYIPPDYVSSNRTVSRRAPEPFVIYFGTEG
ncbi:MAG: SH3 domain-containing protein [Spirochaetaceae bacterium]|nr:SH3 domain-containing protein [Spirochaetaceae bacterium]